MGTDHTIAVAVISLLSSVLVAAISIAAGIFERRLREQQKALSALHKQMQALTEHLTEHDVLWLDHMCVAGELPDRTWAA